MAGLGLVTDIVSCMEDSEQAPATVVAVVPERCEACWSQAVSEQSWAQVSVEDAYLRLLAAHREWPSDHECGGIFVNGVTPTLCEAHMQPWGHRRNHSAALHTARFADDPISV